MSELALSTRFSILAAVIGQPILWLHDPQKELGQFAYYSMGAAMLVFLILAVVLHFIEKLSPENNKGKTNGG